MRARERQRKGASQREAEREIESIIIRQQDSQQLEVKPFLKAFDLHSRPPLLHSCDDCCHHYQGAWKQAQLSELEA